MCNERDRPDGASKLLKFAAKSMALSFTREATGSYNSPLGSGGIAQLGERLHGMQEVSGSIPLTSTSHPMNGSRMIPLSPSSRGLGHRPFTAVTGVRIPLGTPSNLTG